MQIVASLDAADGSITLHVRGSAGGNVSDTSAGSVGRGGNAASLFTWSGGVASLGQPDAGFNNLGGRTELEGQTPEGTKPFSGEIALLNVYDSALSDDEVDTLFTVVAGADLPKIVSFAASDSVIGAGSPTTLSWETAKAEKITITPEVGDVTEQSVNGAGSIMVTPTQSTTYTLSVEGNGQTLTSELLVIVGAPIIESFEVDGPSLISQGSEAMLIWEVLGSTALSIDNGVGDVTGTNQTTVSPNTDTAYTLSATNEFGTSTAQATILVSALPVPSNAFIASGEDNDDTIWVDPIDSNDWNLTDAELRTDVVSEGTNITAAYALIGDDPEITNRGGVAQVFPLGNTSVEVWIRVGDLDDGHQVIFENGGGSNGSSIMVTEDTIRYIGSQGNARNVDIELPIQELFLDDFIQIVYAINDDEDLVDLYARDTQGKELHVQGEGAVTRGGNGPGLFVWASGGLGGNHNNLGGRTEIEGESPDGLTNFRGEIAIVNVYEETLTAAQIEALHQEIATGGTVAPEFAITSIEYDAVSGEIMLTWNSSPGRTYTIEDSNDMVEWLELNDGLESDGAETTATVANPGTPLRYYRVVEEE